MLDKIIPKKIIYLAELIRLKKPIGIWLLMWPCWFGMANLQHDTIDLIYWYILFLIGAFFMRSAGCIINDIIDIKLDKKIKRTSNRPLTSKKISIYEAIIFLLLLLILSLIVLFQFNTKSILIGLVSLPIIIIYPFLKRYTHWPQLGLGLAFNWGVLIVSVEFLGNITFDFLLLYIACIFWTLAYDTIYAYQDKEDDVQNNIKSTAVLFGNKGHHYVQFFYAIFFIIIGFLGYISSKSFYSLIVIISLFFVIRIYLNKWKLDSVKSSLHYFKFNNIIGLLLFSYLLIF